jgi:hypothetical protein
MHMDLKDPRRTTLYAAIIATTLFMGTAFVSVAYDVDIFMPIFLLAAGTVVAYVVLRWHAGRQMAIRLDQSVFFAGDDITGTVVLHLGKEKKARALSISLCTRMHARHDAWLARPCSLKLSGSKEYGNGEQHAFEIKVPENILPRGDWGALDFLYRIFRPAPEEIFLEAKLEIPGRPAIIATQEIEIMKSVAGSQRAQTGRQ